MTITDLQSIRKICIKTNAEKYNRSFHNSVGAFIVLFLTNARLVCVKQGLYMKRSKGNFLRRSLKRQSLLLKMYLGLKVLECIKKGVPAIYFSSSFT